MIKELKFQAKALAGAALEGAETDEARAGALTALARAAHAGGAFQDALAAYQQVHATHKL